MRSRRLITTLASASVLALAACGGGGDGADDTTPEAGGGALVAEAGAVTIEGTDTLKWSSETIETDTTPLEVTVTCGAGINHTFLIEETGDEPVAECEAGGTATGTTSELEVGTYVFYCDVPGHRSAGMEGTLVVGG